MEVWNEEKVQAGWPDQFRRTVYRHGRVSFLRVKDTEEIIAIGTAYGHFFAGQNYELVGRRDDPTICKRVNCGNYSFGFNERGKPVFIGERT